MTVPTSMLPKIKEKTGINPNKVESPEEVELPPISDGVESAVEITPSSLPTLKTTDMDDRPKSHVVPDNKSLGTPTSVNTNSTVMGGAKLSFSFQPFSGGSSLQKRKDVKTIKEYKID